MSENVLLVYLLDMKRD